MKDLKYCPQCGSAGLAVGDGKRWFCQQCDFSYYHNMAAAVAAVLLYDNEILMTVRKHSPAEGMLDLPGGFVDYNETLEQALTREIKEELNITLGIHDWRYLFSYPNRYEYDDITYYTSDVFFISQLLAKPEIIVSDDVADYLWIKIKDIKPEKIGLDSVRKALFEMQQMEIG
jgi:ADP-ribose pyrophosphatase YjhB (NUDIX family)